MANSTYSMAASREPIAALGATFGEGRFDEYSIIANPKLPLTFLDSRRVPQRVCVARWLTWAATQNIGLTRDADNPTWFRVLPGATGSRGIAERNPSLINSRLK